MYRGGSAYAQTGERYVAYWPASNVVFYRGPFAHRSDGALVISTDGTEFVRPQGAAVTFRGEILAIISAAQYVQNLWELTAEGFVCFSDVGDGGDFSGSAWGTSWGDAWGGAWGS